MHGMQQKLMLQQQEEVVAGHNAGEKRALERYRIVGGNLNVEVDDTEISFRSMMSYSLCRELWVNTETLLTKTKILKGKLD